MAEALFQARQIDLARTWPLQRNRRHQRPPFWSTAVRRMIQVPRMFTARVMASSTRAAYIKASISIGDASGNLLARSAAKVLEGASTDQEMLLTLPTSIARAIVSPSA